MVQLLLEGAKQVCMKNWLEQNQASEGFTQWLVLEVDPEEYRGMENEPFAIRELLYSRNYNFPNCSSAFLIRKGKD